MFRSLLLFFAAWLLPMSLYPSHSPHHATLSLILLPMPLCHSSSSPCHSVSHLPPHATLSLILLPMPLSHLHFLSSSSPCHSTPPHATLQERLDQLDNNFMSLEDEMPGEELGRDQVEQISDLQTYHHDIQQYLQTMGLVVGTFQGYLSLAQKIQEVAVLLEDACVCFGSSHELESRRVALQVMSL